MPYFCLVSSSCIANIFDQGAELEGDKYVFWISVMQEIKAMLI